LSLPFGKVVKFCSLPLWHPPAPQRSSQPSSEISRMLNASAARKAKRVRLVNRFKFLRLYENLAVAIRKITFLLEKRSFNVSTYGGFENN
jgi:hypothetical protein